MLIRAAGRSDHGQRLQTNDDHYCLGPFVEQDCLTTLTIDTASMFYRHYGLLVAVADGMGGYAGGAVASRMVLETLSALYYGESRAGCSEEEFLAALQRYAAQTLQLVSRKLQQTPALASAGTTLAGIALMPPDLAVIFHAGDSRVLRASAGFVRPLTVDHTPVGMDVASGRLSEEEAAQVESANRLTHSLGAQGNADIEWNVEHTVIPGNQFYLGTDGWHGLGRGLTRKAIQELARRDETAEELVNLFIRESLAADGQDNITAVVVQCEAHGLTHVG